VSEPVGESMKFFFSKRDADERTNEGGYSKHNLQAGKKQAPTKNLNLDFLSDMRVGKKTKRVIRASERNGSSF
jgi:hypothetical protein